MVDQNIVTNITATANFSSLTAQLSAVTSELVKLQATTIGLNKNLSNQIGVMNRSFVETMRSTGQFSSHFVTLTSDVETFGKKLDSGRLKLGDYYKTWRDHASKTSNIVRDLAKQQVLMQQAVIQPLGRNAQGQMQYNVMLANGLDEIKNKTALLRQESLIMNKVMQDGANQLINWGKNTQWAGRQLTVGLTVPLAAFGVAASKAFREADQELVRLTKVYGGLAQTSQADLAKVRKDVSATAKELASTYGASFKDTISLAADIAATGKQGDELLKATAQTTRLAILGEVERQDAMKATLSIQSAFKQNTEQLTESIDFLNAVENQTSTTLADLVEAIPKAGPVVQSLGGDVKDLALYLTAMREGGINASEGANALKSALASIINPTNVAKEMFDGFGISLESIVTNNAGNLTNTILALQGALDTLDPLSKSRAIEQLFGKFQFARMNALFENLGKEGSQTLQVIDLMKSSTMDLANISSRELTAITESASGKYRRALESVKADLAGVGETFLKINTYVLQTIDGIVKFVTKLPEPVKNILTFMGSLTALAGPLIMLTGVLGNFFGYIVKGIFHIKNLFKGGAGWKLLTTEMMAAEHASGLVEKSFYSDAKATAILSEAVHTLADSFDILKVKALEASSVVSTGIKTMSGNPVVTPAGMYQERIADKSSPYIGQPYSRQMAHLIPSGQEQPGTIFGTVPNPGPVNVRVSNNPQMYMADDLPRVPGVTSISGVSTGIVASEAAKWHAMTAAIASQSEAELALLKTEVSATGTVTHELSSVYQAMLPQMTELTELAAEEGKLIVNQLQAGVLTVDQARAKIIQLNATIEIMMAETASQIASGMGRTINLTTVPLTRQPAVDPVTGKSNMKELFHKGATADLMDDIARGLGGVRTSGGGYSIETTKPSGIILPKRGPIRGFSDGGYVYTLNDGPVVPGDTSINYDNTLAKVPEGGFVLNQDATRNNPQLVQYAKTHKPYKTGGYIDAMLTPGETVFTPEQTSEMLPVLEAANSGKKIEFRNAGGVLGGVINARRLNYGRTNSSEMIARAATGRRAFDDVARFMSNPRWEQEFKSRAVLNDSMALFMAGEKHGMSMQEAINIAEAMEDEAFSAAHVGGQFSQSEYDAISQEQIKHWEKKLKEQYPDIKLVDDRPKTRTGKSQRASLLTGASGIAKRTAILELMKSDPRFDPRVLSTISIGKHGFDRAHTRPMGTWSEQGVGYLRQAIITDQTPNYASNQLSIYGVGRDILPRTTQGALDVIDERSRILGFDSVQDYFEKEEMKKKGRVSRNPKAFNEFIMAFARRNPAAFRGRLAFNNAGGVLGGMINSAKSHYGRLFLGMPKTIKQVEAQRLAKKQMEDASKAVETSRFAKDEPADFGKLLTPTSGRSFPVSGIGGVYERPDGTRVFVKPVLDEKAALAEQRATVIAREVHGLDAPQQQIKVMRDPTDPKGKRKILVLESPYDKKFASMPDKFSEDDYFRQLVASALRGDKDLGRGNLGGNVLADVGTAGVFDRASGLREYSSSIASMGDQAKINLLGTKGGAKRFFAESTSGIAKNLTPAQYSERMLSEIDRVLPKLKETISKFDLNAEEYALYQSMIKRLEDSKSVNWAELHGTHLAVTHSKEKTLTPAALAKIAEAEALKRRQKGHAVGLYDMGFKSDANGFNYGGPIQARALGGPVARSNPYLVGENGPEIFVPGTSGKILPAGFNKGGPIPGYNLGAFIGKGFLKQMIMSTIVAMVGQQIGQAVGGTAGQVISTAAYMIPIGTGAGKAFSRKPKGNTWQDPAHGPLGIERAAAKTWASRVPTSFTKPLPGMEKASANLAKLGANGGRFSAVLTRLAPMLARLPLLLNPAGLAFAAVSLAVAGGVVWHKKHAEAMRLNALGYGLTAEAAKKAGLKVTDYSAKLKQSIENAKLLREKNHLIFESMKFANTPLDITIKEFKALKKEVNSVYSDQVKLFDQTNREDVGALAVKLKAQFIGAGMSADDATKKIYTMIAASNKADLATSATVGNKTFANIKTGMDAAKVGVSTYEDAASKQGRNFWWSDPRNVKDPEAQVAAFNNAMQSLDTAVAEVIAKDKARIVKEGGDLSKVISVYQAEQQVLKQINNTKAGGVTLTEETIAELSKTNPVLSTILDTSDTITSAWEKNTLLQRGFVHDLGNFLPEQAHAALVISDAVQSAVDSISRSTYFKAQFDLIESYGKTIEKLRKAAAGQKVKDQISDREKLEAINKQIKANNDLYNARRKALEAQRAENSLQTEIAKKRIEIQQAASTGNTSDAQILQLDLNDLLDQQQTDSMLKALENANIAANKPLEAAADALSEKQQKLADTAALAQESLADYIAKQDKLKEKTSAFAGLMGTYYTNLSTATDPKAWSQTQEALDQIAAIGKAAEAAGLKLADFDPSKDAFKDAQAFVREFGSQIAGSKFMTEGMTVTAQKVVVQRQADVLNSASNDPVWKKEGYTTKMGPNGYPQIVDSSGRVVDSVNGAARNMPFSTKHTQALLQKYGVTGNQYGVSKPEAWNKMVDIHLPILGSGTQVKVDGTGKASTDAIKKLYEDAKKNGIDVSKFTASGFGFTGKNIYQPETGETYPSITYTTDGFVRARVGNKIQTIGRWFNKGPFAQEFYTYAGGGSVSGPGTATSDSIPALLSNGEYVINASAVNQYGVDTFDKLNAKKLATGGPVGKMPSLPVPVGSTATSNLTNKSKLGSIAGSVWNAIFGVGKNFVESVDQVVASASMTDPLMSANQKHRQKVLDIQNKEGLLKALLEESKYTSGAFATTLSAVAPWESLLGKIGVALPGKLEHLAPLLLGSIDDIGRGIYQSFANNKKAEGGLIEGEPFLGSVSLATKIKAVKDLLDAGGVDPITEDAYRSFGQNVDVKTVDSFTKNEQAVSDYLHAWIGMLNTYYAGKYDNLFVTAGKKSLTHDPINQTLQVTDPRNLESLTSFVKFGVNRGEEMVVSPTTQVAGLSGYMYPNKQGKLITEPTFSNEVYGSKFNVKNFSDKTNENILNDPYAKITMLEVLFHEYGHALQSKFQEARIFDNFYAESKIFKDTAGQPLWTEHAGGNGNAAETNADLMAGSIMAEMFNNGYLKNIPADVLTKHMKSKLLVDVTKTPAITAGQDAHPTSSRFRFSTYMKGFLNGNSDLAIADYFGVDPKAKIGDMGRANKTVEAYLNAAPQSAVNNKDQDAMPDLLNRDYAKILGLKTKPVKKAPPLKINTPDEFTRALVYLLGGKPTRDSYNAMRVWMKREGGHWNNAALYNPLNTTYTMPGSKEVNIVNKNTKRGVQAYKSWEDGLNAVVETLQYKSQERGYDKVISSLINPDSKYIDILQAISESAWGAPKYDLTKGANASYFPTKPWQPGQRSWFSDMDPRVLFDWESIPLPDSEQNPWLPQPEDGRGPDKSPGDGGEGSWDNPIGPDGTPEPGYGPKRDFSAKPLTRYLTGLEYAYPLMPIQNYDTAFLSSAVAQVTGGKKNTKKRTRSGIDIASNAPYQVFRWGSKTWSVPIGGLTDQVFSFDPKPIIDVQGNKAADGSVRNVIDLPDNEKWYYLFSGAITRNKNNPGVFRMQKGDKDPIQDNRWLEKLLLGTNGEVGFKSGTLIPFSYPYLLDYYSNISGIPLPELGGGNATSGFKIPKFDSGINMVPDDMLALIHKNEAVVPASMNPFNPNANSAMMGGNTYNINNTINGADQDINVLSDIVSRKTIAAIKQLDRINAKMVGTGRSN